MKPKFNLTVKSPCSEKFENFNTTPAGGFCNSCVKEVIDFTTMNDKEVINYFNNRQEKTCGRFNQSQLKTYSEYEAQQKRTSYSVFAAFGLSVISILSSSNATAQQKKPKVEITSTKKSADSLKESLKKERIFKGRVTDIDGTLPGVSVLIKGTTNGGETNFDGMYSVTAKPGDILVFSYLGYETVEFTIKKNTTSINIKLVEGGELLGMVVMGEVDSNKLYKSKRSLWDRVKNLF
ncbi:MAG: carboxypeptidase-like regulatory domain-containing protein [Flavobacteriaceae bacterium]